MRNRKTKKSEISEEETLNKVVDEAVDITRTARRNNKSLNGGNYYSNRFTDLHSKATIAARRIAQRVEKSANGKLKESWSEIATSVDLIFDPTTTASDRAGALKRIKFLLASEIAPEFADKMPHSPTDKLFPLELVADTRDYIVRIAEQACGAYDQKWFDASAVMIRRLLETLIIECFEKHQISEKIKTPDGSFFFLRDLISHLLQEKIWNIGRNVRTALPKMKDIGDQSAHSRRFTARQGDIDNLKSEVRITIEELVHLSGLK